MRRRRFSVEQMIGVLKQAEVGVPVAEVIRKAGISEQTFYRWKAKYAGLEVDQVRQMAQLHLPKGAGLLGRQRTTGPNQLSGSGMKSHLAGTIPGI
jgi:hypothetical protein